MSGRKTETRRSWQSPRVAAGETHAATIAGREFAQLRVLSVQPQQVSDFTDDDARAEGYESVDQLWDGLLDAYGELNLSGTMLVVRFEVLP